MKGYGAFNISYPYEKIYSPLSFLQSLRYVTFPFKLFNIASLVEIPSKAFI